MNLTPQTNPNFRHVSDVSGVSLYQCDGVVLDYERDIYSTVSGDPIQFSQINLQFTGGDTKTEHNTEDTIFLRLPDGEALRIKLKDAPRMWRKEERLSVMYGAKGGKTDLVSIRSVESKELFRPENSLLGLLSMVSLIRGAWLKILISLIVVVLIHWQIALYIGVPLGFFIVLLTGIPFVAGAVLLPTLPALGRFRRQVNAVEFLPYPES